jgi:hypothetical protein
VIDKDRDETFGVLIAAEQNASQVFPGHLGASPGGWPAGIARGLAGAVRSDQDR